MSISLYLHRCFIEDEATDVDGPSCPLGLHLNLGSNLTKVGTKFDFIRGLPDAGPLKGFATFWEFSFYSKKGSLIMNITVFLLNKFIFILNFSFLMSSNLSLFPQTWGLSTENNLILDI